MEGRGGEGRKKGEGVECVTGVDRRGDELIAHLTALVGVAVSREPASATPHDVGMFPQSV